MKTLLAVSLCLFVLVTALADEGPPPQPQGATARFTVTAGMVDHGSGPVPTFIRLDTHTGQTWLLQQVPLPAGGGAMMQVWVPSHEQGGDLYKMAMDAMTKSR